MKRFLRRLDQSRADETAIVAKLGPHDVHGIGCNFEGSFFGRLGSNIKEEIYPVDHATTQHDSLRVPEIDQAGQAQAEVDTGIPDAFYYEGVALFYGLGEWL